MKAAQFGGGAVQVPAVCSLLYVSIGPAYSISRLAGSIVSLVASQSLSVL